MPFTPAMDRSTEQSGSDDNDRSVTSISREQPRTPRTSRLPPAFNDQTAGHATIELASIMTVSSNHTSPGPSSPPLDQIRNQEFVPPTRPSSTPFPHPDSKTEDVRCLSCAAEEGNAENETEGQPGVEMTAQDLAGDDCMDLDSVDADAVSGDSVLSSSLEPSEAASSLNDDNLSEYGSDHNDKPHRQRVYLHQLPTEIQEAIMNYVFDCRISATTKTAPDTRLTRLACISPVWRDLIQERLYSFIKLRATLASLEDARVHFAEHPHLRGYVKHVEFWFPVFHPRSRLPIAMTTDLLPPLNLDGPLMTSYTLPSDNCSLEKVFGFVSRTFDQLHTLTLEGGERKKAPQVRHFTDNGSTYTVSTTSMPKIDTVRTLICKGQWNLMRSEEDFHNIASALPNLQQWNASYSKPKSKSYLTMATILPRLPTNLTSLDLCLEGDYRQEVSFPPFFLKVTSQVDFCSRLAEATPALQHLSYTGRVCRTFFDVAARLADPRATRLKSVDLTVKNCCRHVNYWHESGSGTTDLHFIHAFELLVLSAVRSMSRLAKLEHLRIRYVDLEFPVPPLNPFFLVHNGLASGVWNDLIVSELNRVRPQIQWEELSETFGDVTLGKDGQMFFSPEFPKKRVASLKLENYAFLAALATM